MMRTKSLSTLLFAATTCLVSVSSQVTPPTEAKTEPVEYSHEGDALLGHLSIPQGGEGPYPGTSAARLYRC